MYPDRKRIRENRLTVRLDEYEDELLRAMSKYLGEHPSTLLRDLALRQAEELFGVSRDTLQAGSLPHKTA